MKVNGTPVDGVLENPKMSAANEVTITVDGKPEVLTLPQGAASRQRRQQHYYTATRLD